MSCDKFTKNVGTTRRITGDWSAFLGTGVSISSVAYTVPSGITQGTPSSTATTETNYYSGGTAGQEYTITIAVTTDESPARIEAHDIVLAVQSNC